jgi:hypothetical protein
LLLLLLVVLRLPGIWRLARLRARLIGVRGALAAACGGRGVPARAGAWWRVSTGVSFGCRSGATEESSKDK